MNGHRLACRGPPSDSRAVATGAPSMTAATPPTSTKRTRWRCRVATIAAKSVGRRGTAQCGHQSDMIVQDRQALGWGEARHPANERPIHVLSTRLQRGLAKGLSPLGHSDVLHNPGSGSQQAWCRSNSSKPDPQRSSRVPQAGREHLAGGGRHAPACKRRIALSLPAPASSRCSPSCRGRRRCGAGSRAPSSVVHIPTKPNTSSEARRTPV